MRRLRIGCVGTGFIARKHLEALSGFDDVDVVAVADPLVERAREAGDRFGAAVYEDGSDLLDQETLDAVYLCVPPFAHGPLERAALERGLPFFVEKPLALDLDTAARVAEAVGEQGLVTAVGYHWRYLDIVQQAAALLADRPVRLLLAYWLDFTPTAPWWSRSDGSGGQLLEQATHLFDLARLLVGEIEFVYAAAARTPRERFPEADIHEVSVTTLRFASGALGTVSSTCLLDWHDRIGLHLLGEGISLELTERELRVRLGGDERVVDASANAYVQEDRDFLDAVKGERNRVRVPYEEALRTHRVTTAALRSISHGLPVAVPTDAKPPRPVDPYRTIQRPR